MTRKLVDNAFAAAAARLRASEDPWDRVWFAHAEDRPVEAVVRERLEGGWRLDIFGLSGFLADDAILDPDVRARPLEPGDRLSVHVLRFDIDAGVLDLYRRPPGPWP